MKLSENTVEILKNFSHGFRNGFSSRKGDYRRLGFWGNVRRSPCADEWRCAGIERAAMMLEA